MDNMDEYTHEELELLKETDYIFSQERMNFRKLIGWANESANRL